MLLQTQNTKENKLTTQTQTLSTSVCLKFAGSDVQTRADADTDTLNLNASSPSSVSDGELYSATVSDFSGSDPLIYKEPLRTDQSDSKHLNCECHSAITLYSDDDAPRSRRRRRIS